MSDLPRIIGLNGVARAGKDTVAGILHDLYGYEVASFSDMLNQALIALNPWTGPWLQDFGREEKYERYADMIEKIGYESAKNNPEIRRLLQAMGTEVGRNLLGEDLWVDALFKSIRDKPLVAITNVRFPNEYYATKQRQGVVWRIIRPGFTPALGHVSDTALDHVKDWDEIIDNNGGLEDLANKVIESLRVYSIEHRGLASA